MLVIMAVYRYGKIYQIVNDEMPGVRYFGSTTMSLNTRFNNHRSDFNNYRNKSSQQLFEYGIPRIELIEEYPCECKRELEERERFFIENNECVNKKKHQNQLQSQLPS